MRQAVTQHKSRESLFCCNLSQFQASSYPVTAQPRCLSADTAPQFITLQSAHFTIFRSLQECLGDRKTLLSPPHGPSLKGWDFSHPVQPSRSSPPVPSYPLGSLEKDGKFHGMIHTPPGEETSSTDPTREQFTRSSYADYRGSPDEKSSSCITQKK